MDDAAPPSRFGIGASLLRREDERHLRGRGEFVADLKISGTQVVVFMRSPHAHARIRGISVPQGLPGRVFTPPDLPRIKPLRALPPAPRAPPPAWPPLATDKHQACAP